MRKFLFEILLVVVLCGCADVEVIDGVGDTGVEVIDDQDALTYMVQTYRLSEDELRGLDLPRLMRDYRIRELDYTREDIRQIIAEHGNSYASDSASSIYALLDAKGRKLEKDDTVVQVAFYVNIGTSVEKRVFDLKEGVYYIGGVESYALTDAQIKDLVRLAERNDVYTWKQKYRGADDMSTGSYEWRLVFVTDAGEYCVYEGYAQDGNDFPDSYQDVKSALLSYK